MPETTVFVVVSGARTGVVFARLPEATTKIVASGTGGDEEKQAEEKEEADQDK